MYHSSLTGYQLEDFSTGDASVTTKTGTYSCLEARFLLRRLSSYSLLTDHVPLVMLVTVSIISFWGVSSSLRVAINVVMLVFASFKADNINQRFPVVAYTKVTTDHDFQDGMKRHYNIMSGNRCVHW